MAVACAIIWDPAQSFLSKKRVFTENLLHVTSQTLNVACAKNHFNNALALFKMH